MYQKNGGEREVNCCTLAIGDPYNLHKVSGVKLAIHRDDKSVSQPVLTDWRPCSTQYQSQVRGNGVSGSGSVASPRCFALEVEVSRL